MTIGAGGSWPLARLGARGASHRPGRAVSSVALVALAAFTIVSVGSFRRGAPADPSDRGSGTGGYALIGESVLPVYHDPGSARGRAALALGTADDAAFEGVSIDRFRLRAGDDASCLTLYRPTRPRLIGATATFVEQGRFAFGASLAGSDDERRNPWRLLSRTFADGAVPAIGDANSLRYVFHVDVGEDVEIPREGADPLRLRIVAALVDSVFQSELVIAEERFTALFPGEEGFRVFLVDVGGRDPVAVETALERTLADQGLDVASTADRLATYHRVENTYLTTFQMLGALGLLLGTIGIGVVLFRNVLERRRELALLRAVGFGGGAIAWLVVAEAALVVGLGALVGTASALLAVAPAIAERRDAVPAGPIVLLVAAVVVAGLGGSVVAARAARRFSLVTSLRTE